MAIGVYAGHRFARLLVNLTLEGLVPRPVFSRLKRVIWIGSNTPGEVVDCGVAIDEMSVPFRMWKQDGSAAVFCDPCAEDVLGLILEKVAEDEA